jgi:hypothetical protein
VVAVAGVVVVAGILLGTRLHFETDVLNLMPRNDPVVSDFRRVLDEFGSLDTLLVAIPVGSEDRLETACALVDALEKELRASPYIKRVQARLDDPIRLADTVLHSAVLFLDDNGLGRLGDQLSSAGLVARAKEVRAALDTPHGMVAKELAVRDPLGFLPLLLSRVNRTPASLKVDYSSGYYLSADHSFVLLLAKPTGPAQDIDFDRALLGDLRTRIEAARKGLAAELEAKPGDVPEVLIGGGHRIAFEDASLITHDIVSNSVSSLIGVMLLFFLAYRRFATAHYAFLPLAVGLALTFIFAALTLGQLNSATSGFAALLVGLGIDFTIVLYGRYLEGRRAGLELTAALDAMARGAGPAVILGAMTTVGTFYAFLITRFVGLREFGLLTGTGIVLMGLAAFTVLPALVVLFDRGRPVPPPVRLFRMGPVLAWARRRRTGVLAAAALVSVGAALLLPRLKFDDDVRHLRSPDNRGVEVQEKVALAFGLSFNSMMVRIEARDEAAALDAAQRLAHGLDGLVAAGVVSSYESVATLLPPREAQERSLAWAAAHPALTDPSRVRRELSKALVESGFRLDAFEPGLATMAEALRPERPITLDVWRGTPVEQVIERSLRHENGHVVTVVTVMTPPGRWRREAPPELVKLVADVPGASLTGVNLVSQRLRTMVWWDAALAGLLGLVVVLAVLFVDFRAIGPSLLCLGPVAVGTLWALGLMAALGFPLNLLNVFVLTMIIGVGSDYGIYVLHRIREGGDLSGLGETARAVMLAAMTTVVGFGSLVGTHYPGLQSMGWMAGFGVTFSCLAALILVPLVVRRGGAPGAEEDDGA